MLITDYKFENENYVAYINNIIILDDYESLETIKVVEGSNLKGVCYRAHNFIEKYYGVKLDNNIKEEINKLNVKIAEMMLMDEEEAGSDFHEEFFKLNVELESIYIGTGLRREMDKKNIEEIEKIYENESKNESNLGDIRAMIKDMIK